MVIIGEHEVPNGWPLGLGNLSRRLRVAESSQSQSATPEPMLVSSSSFSSFSSSNLDTESTASFFQDRSMSLGRLIGIRPGARGSLYFPNAVRFEQRQRMPENERRSSNLELCNCSGQGMSQVQGQGQRLCVPLLLNVIAKMSRSKSNSRQSFHN